MTPVWEAFEAESAATLGSVLEAADVLIGAQRLKLARDLVARFSHGRALRALDLGEAMVASMDARSRVLFGIRDERSWRGAEQLW